MCYICRQVVGSRVDFDLAAILSTNFSCYNPKIN